VAYFKDRDGREWTVSLDAPTIEAIRERYHIDLADLQTPQETWSKIRGNLPLTAMLTMFLCERQANERHVTPQQFAALLTGDTIDAAFDALAQAAHDFFPQGGRLILSHLTTQMTALKANALKKATPILNDPRILETLIAAQDAEIQKQMDALEAAMSSASAGSTPAQSESAPTD
jgi:hypothetical protein